MVTLLFVSGQQHGDPQSDPRGAAGDQHHFLLAATRHGNSCQSQLRAGSEDFKKLKADNATRRSCERVMQSHGRQNRLVKEGRKHACLLTLASAFTVLL